MNQETLSQIKIFCHRNQAQKKFNHAKFEKRFAKRCYVTMLVKIVTSISLAILGQESFMQAQKLASRPKQDTLLDPLESADPLESDIKPEEYNQAWVDSSTGILSIVLIALTIGRVFLLLYALRDQRITRCFFYYEAMIEMVGHFLPQTVYSDEGTGQQVWMLLTLVNYILLYSNFKWSLLVSLLSLVTFQTGSYLVYARDPAVGHITVNVCILLLWLVISLGLIHKLTLTIDASFTDLKDAEEDNIRLL